MLQKFEFSRRSQQFNRMKAFFLNIGQTYQDIYDYREVVKNFVVTNLKMRYKRSVLGFLWTLLNPLLTMAITVTVFSLIFRFNLKNYAIYIFCGLVPWNFINSSAINGSIAIISNEGYIKKIFLPKILFPLNAVVTEFVNSFFNLISLFLLGIFLNLEITPSVLILPYAFLTMFIFCQGMAMVLSVWTVYFRDLHHIVQITFSALFYLCPIIYPIERFPEKYRFIFDLNPFNYYITMFRDALYYNRWSDARVIQMSAVLAVVSLLLGYILFSREEKKIIFRL